jgi:hypothetical protein
LIAYFVIRNLLSRLDPDAQQKEEAKQKATAASRRLDAILANKQRDADDSDDDEERGGYREKDGRRRRREKRVAPESLQLTSYEQTIAMEVVSPEEIPVSFDGMIHYFLYSL